MVELSRSERRRARAVRLLDSVREYCDVETGRVLRSIPSDLMSELRRYRLAAGVHLGACGPTGHRATWFVYFDARIQAKVERAIRTLRHHGRGSSYERNRPSAGGGSS